MADQENPKRVFVLHECDNHKILGDDQGRIGIVNATKEGTPISPDSDLVHFTPVEGEPQMLDMHTIRVNVGPSKVSTPKYRSGWDTVFKKKAKKEELN